MGRLPSAEHGWCMERPIPPISLKSGRPKCPARSFTMPSATDGHPDPAARRSIGSPLGPNDRSNERWRCRARSLALGSRWDGSSDAPEAEAGRTPRGRCTRAIHVRCTRRRPGLNGQSPTAGPWPRTRSARMLVHRRADLLLTARVAHRRPDPVLYAAPAMPPAAARESRPATTAHSAAGTHDYPGYRTAPG